MHISKYFLPALTLISLAVVMTVALWYGAQRVMLQDFIPRDLDHIGLMGRLAA